MPTERKLDVTAVLSVTQLIVRLLATFAFVEGLVITFGGRERLDDDTFSVALKVPGSPPTWGIVILALGLTALIGTFLGSLRAVQIGMLGASAWSMCFATTFIIGAFTTPGAELTSIAIYTTIAILYAMLGVVYGVSGKTNSQE